MPGIVPTAAQIEQVLSQLPSLVSKTGHSEIYNIDVSQSDSDPVKLIAGKYLRARSNDVEAACRAIEETLLWRKEFQPRKAAYEERHADKFDGIGYNTVLSGDVIVWNIYGALQDRPDPAELFQPLEAFLRWRIGLMERCIDLLKLSEYTGDGIHDPKQAIQIHDYMRVSFFRMDTNQRATTKQVIDLMSKHYPESMKAKYMINVPFIMSWVMSFVKTFLSRDTLSKITVMSYGSGLAEYIGHENELPKAYGGTSHKTLAELAENA